MIIQSISNPKIKHVVQLHNKNYRYKHQEFIAQGLKTCKSLLDGQFQLKSLFITQDLYLQHQQDFLIEDVYIVTDDIMKHISTTTTPTGIVGIFAMQSDTITATENAVVLYNIQDPGNVGTLIRSANAMNIDAIYFIDCVDIYNPKVIQATTGAVAATKLYQTSWQIFQQTIHGLSLCALTVQNGKKPNEIPLKNSILLIGNEGQGLPQNIIQNCTYTMTIPMPGNTESLNAAIAGSIAMYLKAQSL